MKRKKAKNNVMKKMESKNKCNPKGSGGCFYFLGVIGAAIYFLQNSTGFWAGVLAILKALVWPVFVVMKILGM